MKKILANEQRQKLITFLMHLNDEYEPVRSQILLLDPLPNVNKAYAMIQRVERQRQVTSGVGIVREIAANVNKINEPVTAAFNARGPGKGRRDSKDNKAARFCTHCKRSGHTAAQCFKLVGYPDWYKGVRDNSQGRIPARMAATAVEDSCDTPLEETPCQEGTPSQVTPGWV